MKVLAVNSSPRAGSYSRTGLMLDALLEGMQDAGARTDLFHTKDLKIRHCQGCFSCWTKTPGRCIFQDDVAAKIMPLYRECDVLILASPLYIHSLNGAMHTLIERLVMPTALPYFELTPDGAWSHPMRFEAPGVVVLSVCGFPEKKAFDPLRVWVDHHFKRLTDRLWAEIYRAGAEHLSALPQKQEEILRAAVQAGRELASGRSVSPETMALVEQPVMEDMEVLNDMVTCFWDSCIENEVTPKEMAERGIVPRPANIGQFLAFLRFGFQPAAAGDADFTVQFDFSGPEAGSCHYTVRGGAISPARGAAAQPDLTVSAPFDVWIDVMTGRLDGAQAFMEQKYSAEGNMDLLMNMADYFGGDREAGRTT